MKKRDIIWTDSSLGLKFIERHKYMSPFHICLVKPRWGVGKDGRVTTLLLIINNSISFSSTQRLLEIYVNGNKSRTMGYDPLKRGLGCNLLEISTILVKNSRQVGIFLMKL